MKIKILIIFLITIFQSKTSFALENEAAKRSYIYMVGSSTISPLMGAVSQEFSRLQSLKKSPITTPLVESSGTTGGFKFFCQGVGLEYPDFVNASRPIESSEIELCKKNGIQNIIEIKIGYDGIIFGNFIKAPNIKLTKDQIFLALAQKIIDQKTKKLINNPYQTWNQIDEKLPNTKIKVYGPPSSSGTRDVFAEMLAEHLCLNNQDFIAAIKNDNLRKEQCHKFRNDGNFIESGENDNLIIQALKGDKDAFGIFGFNFLIANNAVIKGMQIDGSSPDYKTIAAKKYPLSRPLFVYFKKEHLNLLPELKDFIGEIINQETIGPKGYLINGGLVAMNQKELKEMQKNISLKIKK